MVKDATLVSVVRHAARPIDFCARMSSGLCMLQGGGRRGRREAKARLARFPISALAVWYYVTSSGLAFALLRSDRRPFRPSPAALLLASAFVATIISLLLAIVSAFASAFVIQPLCPPCATLYAVNVTTLIVAWRILRATEERLGVALNRKRRYWKAKPRSAAVLNGRRHQAAERGRCEMTEIGDLGFFFGATTMTLLQRHRAPVRSRTSRAFPRWAH